MEAAYESAPRAARPEWARAGAGGGARLPLKLADGRLAAPPQRSGSAAGGAGGAAGGAGGAGSTASGGSAGGGADGGVAYGPLRRLAATAGGAGGAAAAAAAADAPVGGWPGKGSGGKRAQVAVAREEAKHARKLKARQKAKDAAAEEAGRPARRPRHERSDGDDDGGGSGSGSGSDSGSSDDGGGGGSDDDGGGRPLRRAASDDGVSTYAAWAALPPRAQAARRAERKALLASLCERVVADPEHNVSESKAAAPHAGATKPARRTNTLAELQSLCADGDPVIRQLAMASAVAVFKDILPGYRIRLPTATELKNRVKKDVRKLRDYEGALLVAYQRLLKFLEVTAKRGEGADRAAAKGGAFDADTTDAGADAADADAEAADAADADADAAADADADAADAAKPRRLTDKEYARGKMAERRAARELKLGLTPYDADGATVAALGATAVRCMCQLLTALPHFNFRANLIAFVVPRMNARDAGVAAACCAAIEDLFAADVAGDASVEVVRVINKMVKDAAMRRGAFLRFNPAALATLLKLRVSAAKRAARDTRARDGRAAHRRAAAEADDEVLSSLKAADAEALEERNANSAAALRAVVAAYFRVLRSPAATPLLPPVLAGLAKFAHLIDVGVVTDLLANLKALLAASMAGGGGGGGGGDDDEDGGGGGGGRRVKLTVEAALNCALTALRIMAGPGELLNADESAFSNFLYGTLLRLQAPREAVHAPLAARAVGALLLLRREYAMERVAAYIHRCLAVALSLPPAAAMALVSVARALLHKYPAAVSMLAPPSERPAATAGRVGADADASGSVVVAGMALGSRDDVFDADHAHALGRTAWPLALLATAYHPALAAFAAAAARHAPLAPSDDADAVYAAYDDSTGAFRPPLATPRPHPLAVKAAQRAAAAAAAAAATTTEGGGAGGAVAGKKRPRAAVRPPPLYIHDSAVAPWLVDITGPIPDGVGAGDAAAALAPPSATTFALHFMDRMGARGDAEARVAAGIATLRAEYDATARRGAPE